MIMKKITSNLFILAILFFAVSCGNSTEQNLEHDHATEHEHTTVEAEENHHAKGELVLDNGNRWIANIETTKGINNMIDLLTAFADMDELDAYKELKKQLETESTQIFQQCTMQGESHTQLHNYLLPMQDYFEGLGSDDVAICKDNFNQLNKHLHEYVVYFE